MSSIESKVKSILDTKTDQIDYGGAFDLIDMLNRNSNSDRQIFDAIGKISRNGDRFVVNNTLQLVDSFFKNCNSNAIKRIITNPVVLGLTDDFYTRDPRYHRTICGLSAEWMNIAQKNRALTQQFIDWQSNVCSYRYKYIMTEKAAKKFTTELTACLELLMMFNRAMQTAMSKGTKNDPILDEILPNIHEIHVRIKELKPTINDNYVTDVISYIEEYCKLCKQAYSDFRHVGTCDLAGLNKIAERGIPQREGQIKAAAPLQPVASMPGQSSAPPSYPEGKDLLDFGSPQSSPSPSIPGQVSAPPTYSDDKGNLDFGAPQPQPVAPMPAPSFEPPMPGKPAPAPAPFMPPPQQFMPPPQPQNYYMPPPQEQYQPPMQSGNQFVPQQGAYQPPMQPGYGMGQNFDAVDDDTVPNDEFMDFLQNISAKR